MRFSAMASLLAASMGAVSAVSVVEVDLVFPRNDTYAPTKHFPIMFAFQNSNKAELLSPWVSYIVVNWDAFNDSWPDNSVSHHLAHANWSIADPYLSYRWYDGSKPGRWLLNWEVTWHSCNLERRPGDLSSKALSQTSLGGSRMFTIANSTGSPDEMVDLVTATRNTSCPGDLNAVAINVTDETMSSDGSSNWGGHNTCAVTTNSTTTTPAHTVNPCGVSLSSEMAASVSAELTALRCRNAYHPVDLVCPKDDESTAQRPIIFALSGLLATAGASAFLAMRSWSLI
ncbi:hypothetical protein BJY00DRAFT_317660 [Aspergillus carlsbadensis]|nr:hypothetical protein BJY00DRAFT_317660 [Aspergillus carlsbadensis]